MTHTKSDEMIADEAFKKHMKEMVNQTITMRGTHRDGFLAGLSHERARSAKLVAQLDKTKAAMTYAYEDHVDQYYLNVLEDIEKALAAHHEAEE